MSITLVRKSPTLDAMVQAYKSNPPRQNLVPQQTTAKKQEIISNLSSSIDDTYKGYFKMSLRDEGEGESKKYYIDLTKTYSLDTDKCGYASVYVSGFSSYNYYLEVPNTSVEVRTDIESGYYGKLFLRMDILRKSYDFIILKTPYIYGSIDNSTLLHFQVYIEIGSYQISNGIPEIVKQNDYEQPASVELLKQYYVTYSATFNFVFLYDEIDNKIKFIEHKLASGGDYIGYVYYGQSYILKKVTSEDAVQFSVSTSKQIYVLVKYNNGYRCEITDSVPTEEDGVYVSIIGDVYVSTDSHSSFDLDSLKISANPNKTDINIWGVWV